MADSPQLHRILILGGGFGGVYTARHLERRFRRDPNVQITLVSRDNYFLMTPLLFEAGSGVLETGEDLTRRLRELLAETATVAGDTIDLTARPAVILVVGVNGTGKTTTIGKIAWHLQRDLGLSVLLGAGDTFRAAAGEQLDVWAQRAGCDIVRGAEGSDPASVIFDAVEAGVARGVDVVICDTAGRLHTQQHLMEELAKVRKVITRKIPDAPHETLLTIDATTGQNGLRQAMLFREVTDVDGIVLTKLDGTAKGGIALAIAQELGLPVKLIGIGVGIEDLRPFDAQDFARAILEDDSKHSDSSPTPSRES